MLGMLQEIWTVHARTRHWVCVLGVASALAVLSACGNKGGVYLPPPAVADDEAKKKKQAMAVPQDVLGAPRQFAIQLINSQRNV
ncbi:MAG: putative small lipoprotein YifL [Gammaproteobacteria bacterium]|jgi:predicted small lipoprotein YifL